MGPVFTFKAKVWLWEGKAAWHFVTLPLELSQDIKGFNEGPRRGFGSVRVNVTIGETSWKTSIFPEKKGTYLMPIKSSVRKKESIGEGDAIQVRITLE